MLTPEQIAALRDAAGQITDPINDFLLDDIARRIAGAGQLTSTASYQVWRAQQMGLSRRKIKKRLRELLGVNRRTLEKLMTQSAEVGYNFDIKHFSGWAVPFRKNDGLQQIVAAAVEMAQADFTNLTQTLGMVDPYGKALPLQEAYRSCMDYAFKQVFNGAADYNTAIRGACKNLAERGVLTIDYQNGVHASLEAAVRRNVMSGLGLMQEQITKRNHDDLGCDGWEISAHANSAPDHEPIQGKQYSDAAYTALNSALVRRIGTLNCGHAAFPIILGVNSPQYTTGELEKFRADNEKGVTYQGKHYTGYEATQMQRKLERSMRTQKRRILVDEAAGDKEKLLTDRIKLGRLREEYVRFSRSVGLRTQPERAQTAGFNNGSAMRSTEAYKRQKAIIDNFTGRMKDAGISVKGFDNYAGDARTLDEMQMAFTRLSGLYPETAKGLTISLEYSKNKEDFGWFDQKNRVIHYNRGLLKNWERLQKDYAELVQSGHFPVGTDARGCFYHEFGHAVWASRAMGSLRKPVDNVLLKLGYGYPNVNQRKTAIAKELSIYAKEQTTPAYQEVIAESFSEWYTSDTPRRFCTEFLREVGIL